MARAPAAAGHAPLHGLRVKLGRHVAPPRFVAFVVLLPITFLAHRALFHPQHWTSSAAVAFDCAAALFLVSLVPILRVRGADAIRAHADANDANRLLVLVVTTLLTVVVMVAIAGELDAAKQGEVSAMVTLVTTLLLIWLFANTVYALHYAHAYYDDGDGEGGDCGGLDFPGEREPEYWDFVYFSFTLGMTFQTSDVDITALRIRQVVVLHCLAAFVFNLGVLAFTINALAGAGG